MATDSQKSFQTMNALIVVLALATEYHSIVITATWRKERLQNAQELCKTLNSSCEILPAINARKNSVKAKLIHQHILEPNTNLKPGQIGCIASHVKAYHQALKSNYDLFLILEDDASLLEDFKTQIQVKFLPNLNKYKWDVFHLRPSDWCSKNWLKKAFYRWLPIGNNMYRELSVPWSGFTSTIGLFTTRLGLEKILATFPISQAIDLHIGNLLKKKKLNVYTTCPPLVIDKMFASSINNKTV